MPEKRTKLILDTNFWISFLISDRLKYLDDIIFGAGVQLVLIKEFIMNPAPGTRNMQI
jgi:predicted nucleic acid-binding protein